MHKDMKTQRDHKKSHGILISDFLIIWLWKERCKTENSAKLAGAMRKQNGVTCQAQNWPKPWWDPHILTGSYRPLQGLTTKGLKVGILLRFSKHLEGTPEVTPFHPAMARKMKDDQSLMYHECTILSIGNIAFSMKLIHLIQMLRALTWTTRSMWLRCFTKIMQDVQDCQSHH